MKEDNPTPEASSSDEGKKQFWQTMANVGNYLAAQAVPLIIGLASFIIAVDAWWSAKAVEWENDRALATMRIRSHFEETAPDHGRSAITTIRIKNVGSLSFAVIDFQLTLQTGGALKADWNRNSLAQPNALLPLGMKPLELMGSPSAEKATFHLDDTTKTYHIIDPGREVEVTFEQPLQGFGHLQIGTMLHTQPIALADMVDSLTVPETIRSVSRQTIPENGEGDISDSPIYPYSGAHIMVVPPQMAATSAAAKPVPAKK